VSSYSMLWYTRVTECSRIICAFVWCVPFFILGAFGKLRKATIAFVMPICPSVRPSTPNNSTPTERIWITFDIRNFSDICRENSVFIQIWLESGALYIKNHVHLWHLVQLFLKWEMFQTKVVEKIKTRILRSITFFFMFVWPCII